MQLGILGHILETFLRHFLNIFLYQILS